MEVRRITNFSNLAYDLFAGSAETPAATVVFRVAQPDDDAPQEGEDREGRQRRRIDIFVERSGPKPRIKYILEAKRLRRNGFPLSAYLGAEGIERFLRGSYAEHALEAAMIGYVQSPSMDDWANELRAAINHTARTRLAVVNGLDPLRVVAELPHSWVGEHARQDAPNMTICHILLNCIV